MINKKTKKFNLVSGLKFFFKGLIPVTLTAGVSFGTILGGPTNELNKKLQDLQFILLGALYFNFITQSVLASFNMSNYRFLIIQIVGIIILIFIRGYFLERSKK